MEQMSVWALGGALVAIAISVVGAVLAARAKQQPVTLEALTGSFSPLRDVVDEAENWVAVAQHLWEQGQIPETNGAKDPRFYWVYDQLRKALPDIDPLTLEYGIEAAVKFAKAAIQRIEAEEQAEETTFTDGVNAFGG